MNGRHALLSDILAEVPGFVYLKSFMTRLDDKAGYDHILLTEES